MTGQGLQRGLLKTHQMRHHHPAQDQVVTITKIGLERSKQTRYFCGQPRHFGHGWPCCWVVKTGFTHPSSYLQGGWPATHPVFVPLAPIRPKRQHNHHANLIYLSSLSNKPNRNEFEGERYPQASGAARVVVPDPKHEYEHVLRQISRSGNSGFVRDFAEAHPHAKEKWREV